VIQGEKLRKSWECEFSDRALRSQQRADERQVYEAACRLLEIQCRVSGVWEIMVGIRALEARPFLFAGAVRDALYTTLTGIVTRPRDYDIGISMICRDRFDAFASSLGAKRNRYGGYQFHACDGLNVDLWRIEDTVGVLANACKPTITNVLRTFVVDLNAIAYDPTDNVVFDQGCLEALRRREIGFVRVPLLHDHSNFAGRAVCLQSRFAFQLSRELRHFVAEWYDSVEAERQHAKTQACGSSESRAGSVGTPLDIMGSESAAVCFE